MNPPSHGSLLISSLVLVLAATAFGLPTPGSDPNDYSCDPLGQVHLLLPHFEDCSKFYSCAHGREVEFVCSGGLIFDFYLQTCNWPSATECILRTRDEGSGEEVNDDMIGRFIDPLEQKTVDSSVRPLAGGSRFNGIINCNRADEAAKQVAYRGDCQRYWKCVEGLAQVVYCTDGLFFNEATQQCDFEANSKCDPNPPVDELQSEFIVYK